jgi:hypothetical protein
MVVFLWSLAVFLASAFAGLIVGITLTPRYKAGKLVAGWLVTAAAGFGLA